MLANHFTSNPRDGSCNETSDRGVGNAASVLCVRVATLGLGFILKDSPNPCREEMAMCFHGPLPV